MLVPGCAFPRESARSLVEARIVEVQGNGTERLVTIQMWNNRTDAGVTAQDVAFYFADGESHAEADHSAAPGAWITFDVALDASLPRVVERVALAYACVLPATCEGETDVPLDGLPSDMRAT
jgi:hypothetical protein